MISTGRLVLFAAVVRAAYIAGNLLLARYLVDYDTSSTYLSESCQSNWPELVAKTQQQYPWVVWDSVFLHRISFCGYEFEQYFAFFPGLPGLVHLIRNTGIIEGPYAFSIITLLLNFVLFLLSTVLLARLSDHFLHNDRLTATAVLVFVASPASIHHSMLYTEALFTASSWLGLYCLYCKTSSLGASLAFAVSSATRSNGLLNAGFILHEHGRRCIKSWQHCKAAAVSHAVQGTAYAAITVAPYFGYMAFGYREFCTGVYGGANQRPWCSNLLPSAYGYVQDKYWGVGFLKYYELKQVPNFLIAAPTLIMSLWGPLAYCCACPWVTCTGGLVSPQQLAAWCSSKTAVRSKSSTRHDHESSNSSKGKAVKGSACRYLQRLLQLVIVGRKVYCCSDHWKFSESTATRICGVQQHHRQSLAGVAAAVPTGAAGIKSSIPGLALAPIRLRQAKADASQQQGHHHQQQQIKQDEAVALATVEAGVNGSGSPRATALQQYDGYPINKGYYSPETAVFIIHWLFLTLVCLAVVHIQVATRFLSSCVPLYWFAALLMTHQGGLLRWLLWWYCFAFMGVGAVFFTNFYPWT